MTGIGKSAIDPATEVARVRTRRTRWQRARIALRKALSLRILAGDVLVVPTFAIANPKTKEFVAAVNNISTGGKTLIVAPEFDNNTKLAARNVATAQLITSADVNTEDLLRYKKIVVTNEALTQLAQRLNK